MPRNNWCLFRVPIIVFFFQSDATSNRESMQGLIHALCTAVRDDLHMLHRGGNTLKTPKVLCVALVYNTEFAAV